MQPEGAARPGKRSFALSESSRTVRRGPSCGGRRWSPSPESSQAQVRCDQWTRWTYAVASCSAEHRTRNRIPAVASTTHSGAGRVARRRRRPWSGRIRRFWQCVAIADSSPFRLTRRYGRSRTTRHSLKLDAVSSPPPPTGTRMPCMRSMTTSMSAEVFQSGRACYLDRLAREREGPCVTDSELRTWGVCPGGEEEDRLDGCVLDPTDVLLRISGKTYAVLRAVWDSRKKLGSLIDPPDPDDRDDVPIPLGGIT